MHAVGSLLVGWNVLWYDFVFAARAYDMKGGEKKHKIWLLLPQSKDCTCDGAQSGLAIARVHIKLEWNGKIAFCIDRSRGAA